jgi:hypothetical protein
MLDEQIDARGVISSARAEPEGGTRSLVGRRLLQSIEADPSGTQILVRQLEHQLGDVTATIVEELRRQFVEFDDLPANARLLAHLGASSWTMLASVVDRRPLTSAERAQLKDIGARASQAGISEGTSRAAVRVAALTLWRLLSDAARALKPEAMGLNALAEMGSVLLNFVNDLEDLIVQGYLETSQQTPTDEPQRAVVIRELLHGGATPLVELMRSAAALGYTNAASYGLVIVLADDQAERSHQGSPPFEVTTKGLDATAIACANPLLHQVIVVPIAEPATWASTVDAMALGMQETLVRLLTCAPLSELAGVRAAYRRLRRLVRAAKTHHGEAHVLWEVDLAVEGLLTSVGEAARQQYITPILGTLLSQPIRRRDQLLETLEALEATPGGIAPAAAKMSLHPKTLQYRLRRIGELTGLDPHAPADRFRLQLALHALRLSEEPSQGDRIYPTRA